MSSSEPIASGRGSDKSLGGGWYARARVHWLSGMAALAASAGGIQPIFRSSSTKSGRVARICRIPGSEVLAAVGDTPVLPQSFIRERVPSKWSAIREAKGHVMPMARRHLVAFVTVVAVPSGTGVETGLLDWKWES